MKQLSALLAAWLVVCLLVVPVSAAYEKTLTVPMNTKEINYDSVTSVSYDASKDGYRVALAQIIVPSNGQVDFTIYYGCSSTVSGSVKSELISVLPPTTKGTVTLNGVSKSYSFIDVQPVLDFDVVGYAKDTNVTPNTNGFLVYSVDYGLFDNDLAAYYPVTNIGANTIYRIDATGTKPFTIVYRVGNPKDIAQGASKSVLDVINEWLALVTSWAQVLYDDAVNTYYWLKFFFVDNLGLTVALYISGTLAFACRQNMGRPDKILRQWFSDQKKLFEFIIGMWTNLVTTVSWLVQIFKP